MRQLSKQSKYFISLMLALPGWMSLVTLQSSAVSPVPENQPPSLTSSAGSYPPSEPDPVTRIRPTESYGKLSKLPLNFEVNQGQVDKQVKSLIYSTYLGGGPDINGFGGFDQGFSIAVDSLGNAYVTGSTNSENFPTLNSVQSSIGGGTCDGSPCFDVFVAKLNPAGSSLVYSTYLGGNGDDFGFGMAVDSSGNAYITGKTMSVNFPHTAGAFDTSCSTDGLCNFNSPDLLSSDVFITKMAPGLPVPLAGMADYNGDGKADFTVYRPSTGQWFVFGAADSPSFGSVNDIPTPGDYNGDGVPDFAFFRPSTGQWYILLSGVETVQNLGQIGDIPVPKDYDGDGKTDCAVFRPTTGEWFILLSGGRIVSLVWGQAGDVPVPADYDGGRWKNRPGRL
jgi:hypothetical protein